MIELSEILLKNNVFEFDEKNYKQIKASAIEGKFAPPYDMLFMADLRAFDEKSITRQRYIDDLFLK